MFPIQPHMPGQQRLMFCASAGFDPKDHEDAHVQTTIVDEHRGDGSTYRQPYYAGVCSCGWRGTPMDARSEAAWIVATQQVTSHRAGVL